MTLGTRLRVARAAKGLRANQLAKQAGISRSYLSSLERDFPFRLSQDIGGRLASVLEVPLDWLVNGDEAGEPLPESHVASSLRRAQAGGEG